ncbi:uncharacterized protein [Physcomitrium patens]|uniref:Methyltransferase domain-containing protein n=1 Tax=Physcomitrium patens TaxID=3218 RepID=A0A7I4BG41_PHYPA|nr:uncharacterized protein LOC112294462 isoform X1 [Physcomitrium patens]|eukprot:XP_024400668.1 uncharacterized protein LOC112294462 isoform X1 [Physcomitrella patens]
MAALTVLPSASLCIRCQASSSSTSTREPYNLNQTLTVPEGTPAMKVMTGAVNALFSFQPFFKFASGQARKMIIERGSEIGYPWEPELARLRQFDWDAELKTVQNPDIEYPEYYLKPFHAYDTGNLSWDAALEVELAAKSVHANVFDPERKVLDPNGDIRLRDSYHEKLLQMLNFTPRAIVDLGCASGLSTFGLHQVFPDAHVIGVDLSPFFISVANFRVKEQAESLQDQKSPVHFLHGAGEYTGLPSGAFDMVSMSLVCHELPRSATKEILEEAHRLLRPGGALTIMEMNPYSPLVQNMVKNVFAFTAFKATEPYFDDYRTFQLERAIEQRGFTFPTQAESSPRHRTMVAIKK